jgi:hypothetical protein
VDRRRLAQVQQLRQPLGVVPVVLVLRPEDQPQLGGVGHQDPGRQRAEQVVVVPVPAARLVAHLEAVRQPLQHSQHLLDPADLRPVDDLPGLVEGADGDAGVVDVEPDVQHGCLPVRVA